METYLHLFLLRQADDYLSSLDDDQFEAMTHDHDLFHNELMLLVAMQCDQRHIRNKTSFLAAFFGRTDRNIRIFFQKNAQSGNSFPTC